MDIMIACSDIIMQSLLKQALANTGVHIYTTDNEQDVAQACKQQNFEIIITMFTHPFISGELALLNIENQGKAHPWIYIISWIQHEQIVLSAYENGVNQYFTLPINIPRLTKKIKDRIFELQL